MTAQVNGLDRFPAVTRTTVSLLRKLLKARCKLLATFCNVSVLCLVQSANDTNSSSDRQALQAEVSQLISESDRIATTTQFNGLNLGR